MKCLIRFTQTHETFRLAEIQALAELENIPLEVEHYASNSPFCFIDVPSAEAAARLIKRSILSKAIYEVWGKGSTYEDLHHDIKTHTKESWPLYKNCSFKFTVDCFQNTRSTTEQRALINEFRYLEFAGPIKMKGADEEFCISEEWQLDAAANGINTPSHVTFGRFLGASERDIVGKYDLKKRKYISTTSMDSELALVTANITLAAPGKLFYDPFVGTGSFPVACAHFGALAFGSDIDGRSIRGKGKKNLHSNFVQYGLTNQFGDTFVADLTNTPLRCARLFDGILCDPPYGVREGLKVLGNRDPTKPKVPIMLEGETQPHHLQEAYIPPKKPYSFLAMLDDILDFAAISLVENGRLSFWMPTANDEDQEIKIPSHPCLHMTSVCTQAFNKWSRRLITYRRIPDSEVDPEEIRERKANGTGVTADELNPFRKGYFQGFKSVARNTDK
ncbi:hypothetical protein SS1G_06746 [Sclerotinia sclerotiorum 1980 UF-70]|uniref:tRNA (guanine(10)-N(2))-methyltransferase n=2 Tax=Sclerotinia sclerotiorum (strain ATCC 18683 / 1980 / Ss-1) TaxID=665079 RepID=A7EN47_SCLS1|nr:hypothetical protein SS1G_06746 [Sclerotinia sclerotiorum 1980 UF-70]APA14738.1 hypothetical protein sscle_13g095080 [Sclerotinia sclerotiorum 1980 UF-70]EDO04263.1 hypothetical protein SS1G_06746 [Sclerotinia sclerotiorum 1980 UF-70]